jgi:hypothetical protein
LKLSQKRWGGYANSLIESSTTMIISRILWSIHSKWRRICMHYIFWDCLLKMKEKSQIRKIIFSLSIIEGSSNIFLRQFLQLKLYSNFINSILRGPMIFISKISITRQLTINTVTNISMISHTTLGTTLGRSIILCGYYN